MAYPNISAAVDTAATSCTASFSTFTTGVSSSCDLMGTIGSLTDKFIKSVVDEVTGVVTEVEVAASEMISDIKDKLSSCFAGSGSVLNSIKGYIDQGKAIAADIAAKASKITTQVMAQLQSLMDTVNSAMQTAMAAVSSAISDVMSAINEVQSKVADAVSGIKQGMCSVMSSVLAGSSDDAFSNITSGASDVALTALGSVKSVYNAGASSVMDVTRKVVQDSGGSTAVLGLQSSTAGMASITTGLAPTTLVIGNSITSMQTILAGIV